MFSNTHVRISFVFGRPYSKRASRNAARNNYYLQYECIINVNTPNNRVERSFYKRVVALPISETYRRKKKRIITVL